MSTLDQTFRAAVEFLWRWYEAHGAWPSRKDFILHAHDAGFRLDAVEAGGLISIRAGSGTEVRPTFDALTALPDVRELLAPLPVVLRKAASTFVADALVVPDNHRPTLHFRDVKNNWSDARRAKLAFDVLQLGGSRYLSGGGASGGDPEDFWFSVDIGMLRFEHVQTLDDVLLLGREFAASAGPIPGPTHVEVLRRIHESSKREQRWPRALEFAIANREVGHVPALVGELKHGFVRGDFQATQRHSLVLTPHALPYVDPSGEDRALLVEAVRATVSIWRSRSVDAGIPLGDLAAELHVSTERLGPVVAFLDWSKWCHVSHVVDDTHANQVLMPGEPDRVLRNEGVRTFDQYMALWEEGEDRSRIVFASGPASALVPSSPTPSGPAQATGVPAVTGGVSLGHDSGRSDRRAASDARFRYDVAISFAGPQRQIAEELAHAIRGVGFEVFIDTFYKEDLWGKDLTVFFDDVFRKQSRFCVIFASSDYASRMWTTRERQSAVARAVEERGQEYILPVRVEDVDLPGLLPTIGYLSLSEHTIQQVAAVLKRKLEPK